MNLSRMVVMATILASASGSSTGAWQAARERVRMQQHRPDVSGREAAVVADHPLAAAAGADVLRRGGHAVDAAIAMAGVLAVVRPHMNGVGGDAFGLFYDAPTGRITALNGSGRAGRLATPEFFTAKGMKSIPSSGAATITVPGAVSAWAAALERHGTMTLAELLEPAIRIAEEGWVVTTTLERDIAASAPKLNAGGRAIFAPGGSLPPAGALLRNLPLAATLRAIASGGVEAFYRGAIGGRLAAWVESQGGYLRADDFRAHRPDWVDPLSLELANGRRVYAMPPNSQGMTQLQMLALAESFDLEALGHNSAEYLHTLIETKRLAFADRDRWLADPAMAKVPVAQLLDRAYLKTRAALVGPRAADAVVPGIDAALGTAIASGTGDTVYLMAVDRHGNAVSWIQSLFASWGSGLVEPETGVVLQNRGSGFVLEAGHPNVVAPGKRPFHTLTPMLVTDASGLRMTMGTPGGHGQPQFLTQVYQNIFTFGMTPQQAVEAPRFIHNTGRRSEIEDRVPAAVLAALRERGHQISTAAGWTATFGGVQVIFIDPGSGARRTGADPRREAYAIAW